MARTFPIWTLIGPAAAAALLSACAPALPAGVGKAALDETLSRSVGDPNTCVLVADRAGRVVHQHGTYVACRQPWPTCLGGGSTESAMHLLQATASKAEPVAASCASNADGSRGVGWAAGPVAGRDLVYTAVMEGPNTPPGRIIAEKLARAFKAAGL